MRAVPDGCEEAVGEVAGQGFEEVLFGGGERAAGCGEGLFAVEAYIAAPADALEPESSGDFVDQLDLVGAGRVGERAGEREASLTFGVEAVAQGPVRWDVGGWGSAPGGS